MGYTHYWTRKPRLDKETWDKFILNANKVLEEADCPLTYYYKGENRKGFKVSSVMVNFNGEGEDSHENVYIPRLHKKTDWGKPDEKGHYFGFCKTAYKPYDKYVTAILLLFKAYFDEKVTISSDGDPNDWEDGRKILYDIGIHITKEAVKLWLGCEDEDVKSEEVVEPVVKKKQVATTKEIEKPSEEEIEKFKDEYFGVDI